MHGRPAGRLVSSNFATAAYSETTNSLSVAYDGNRLILNDLELRQQFPNAAHYPAAPPASPTKPFSVDHMLGPSFVSVGQEKLLLQAVHKCTPWSNSFFYTVLRNKNAISLGRTCFALKNAILPGLY